MCLECDPNYRATKTMTQLYEERLAAGIPNLGGLKQLALAEQDPDLPPSLEGLHAVYLAVLARQAAAKTEEEEELRLQDSGSAD
jgi:hypothetical protein